LPLGKCHEVIVGEQKEKVKSFKRGCGAQQEHECGHEIRRAAVPWKEVLSPTFVGGSEQAHGTVFQLVQRP